MSSKRRRKRGRPRSKACLPVLSTPITKSRKQWSDESVLAAIEAVKNGEPLLRAVVMFGIPRTTLGDRMRGKVAGSWHEMWTKALSFPRRRATTVRVYCGGRSGWFWKDKERNRNAC